MKKIIIITGLLFTFNSKIIASDINAHDLNLLKKNICLGIENSSIKNTFVNTISQIQYLENYNPRFLTTRQQLGFNLFYLIHSFSVIESAFIDTCPDKNYLYTYFQEAYLKDGIEYCNMINDMPEFASEYMDETGFCYTTKRDLRRLNNRRMFK
jgi:hypothetical protein